MAFVLKALAKATASAAAGGLLASQACAQLNINGAPATSAVVAGSVSAFLYYCRVWYAAPQPCHQPPPCEAAPECM